MLKVVATESWATWAILNVALGELFMHNRLQLLLRSHALLLEWIGLRFADSQALGHLGILVSVTLPLVSITLSHLLRASLHFVLIVLHCVGLVDVKSEVLLQFLNFALGKLHLLEILLCLLLQGSIWLHQVIIELDKLLHLLKRISGHLCLILNVAFGSISLSILIAGNKSLILSRKHHNSLFKFHLGLHLLLRESFNLISLESEIDFNKVGNLIKRTCLLRLENLLWWEHCLKTATHIQHWFVLLDRDKTT